MNRIVVSTIGCLAISSVVIATAALASVKYQASQLRVESATVSNTTFDYEFSLVIHEGSAGLTDADWNEIVDEAIAAARADMIAQRKLATKKAGR